MVQKFYQPTTNNPARAVIDSVRAKAFLTLPLALGSIAYDISPQHVSLSVCNTVSPSLLHGQGDQRLRFTAAMNVLSLKPCGLEDEDEEGLSENEEEESLSENEEEESLSEDE